MASFSLRGKKLTAFLFQQAFGRKAGTTFLHKAFREIHSVQFLRRRQADIRFSRLATTLADQNEPSLNAERCRGLPLRVAHATVVQSVREAFDALVF